MCRLCCIVVASTNRMTRTNRLVQTNRLPTLMYCANMTGVSLKPSSCVFPGTGCLCFPVIASTYLMYMLYMLMYVCFRFFSMVQCAQNSFIQMYSSTVGYLNIKELRFFSNNTHQQQKSVKCCLNIKNQS